MKAKVRSVKGKVVKKIELPKIFTSEWKPEVVKRAVIAEQSSTRNLYGSSARAGLDSGAHYHGRRRTRWTMMNRELSRLPRLHSTTPQLNFEARVAPHARKGRKAHPPKAAKLWKKKINKKEKVVAIKSAIAATAKRDLVSQRHRIGSIDLPLIVQDEIATVNKTHKIKSFLEKLGLKEELKRVKKRKIRAGKGTMRGRKYKKKVGPLFVVKKDKGIFMGARNIPGVGVLESKLLRAESLSPGASGARLVIWSESALKELEEI